MTGLVHTHGSTEGRGLDCPERMADGQLRGACMEPAGWTIVDAHQCTRCGYLDRARDGIMEHLRAHDAADERPRRPADNVSGDPIVHLVREGRYPHAVVRGMSTPVRQSQRLDEVSCAVCLAKADGFLRRIGPRG